MDTAIYRAITSFMRQTPWLHGFMAAYALWGGLVVLSLMLIGAWWFARRRPDALRLIATCVLTGVATVVAVVLSGDVISPLVGRVRPCHALSHVTTLLPCNADYSMPSDHAIIAGAFAAGLWMVNRQLGIVAAVLSLLLAFSRVYVGVHYPSDVLVGLVAGVVITIVLNLALHRVTYRAVERLANSRWSWAVTSTPRVDALPRT